MTEPSDSKRRKIDESDVLQNGSSNDDEHTISSSSTTELNGSDKHNEKHQSGANLKNLMGEADRALQESNKRHLKPVVDEVSLGIELFVGDRSKQYHGLIKSRYADFIVHEIDLDGQMAKLTSMEPPEDEESVAEVNIQLEDLFDRKVLMCLSSVNQGLLDYYKIDVTGMDKDLRTSIHHAIKAAYDRLDSSTVSGEGRVPDFRKDHHGQQMKEPVENATQKDSSDGTTDVDSTNIGKNQDSEAETTSDTNNVEKNSNSDAEKKYIMVKKQNKPNRPRNIWPKNRPDFMHFVLYKENKDTMDAIHNLAVATHSKPAQFNYAGTKDRRAVTSQWVSSWRLDPKRLLSAMRRFNRRPYLKVGNFCFKKDTIHLGELRANKFDIVIRNLVHNSGGVDVIRDAMDHVRENGFVNYFGLQRFGSRSVYTHEIGIAILQGKWDKAVELILSYRYDDSAQSLPNASQDQNPGTPNSNSQPESQLGSEPTITSFGRQNQRNQTKRWNNGAEQHNACIDMWKAKQDADLVFKRFPHFKMTNEGLIIRSLGRSNETGNRFCSAIESLPRNTRSMYVHAYQSLLWNKLTTFRLKIFGYKVTPGDLILCPEANISDNSLDVLMTVDASDTSEIDSTVHRDDQIEKAAERKMPVDAINSNIIIANESDLDKYTIFDVVLPLIGTKTRIPTNEVGVELERLLAEDGLTLESFRAREKIFISYGSYRKIMVRPDNLEWSLKHYSNPNQNLIQTDLDQLNRKGTQVTHDDDDSKSKELELHASSGSSDEALLVSFELPPSSYATMCLRELMKKPSTDFNNRF